MAQTVIPARTVGSGAGELALPPPLVRNFPDSRGARQWGRPRRAHQYAPLHTNARQANAARNAASGGAFLAAEAPSRRGQRVAPLAPFPPFPPAKLQPRFCVLSTVDFPRRHSTLP